MSISSTPFKLQGKKNRPFSSQTLARTLPLLTASRSSGSPGAEGGFEAGPHCLCGTAAALAFLRF